LTTFTVCATCSVDTQLETSILNEFVQRWRQIKESDGFAQRLLICSPEHRATKKPLLLNQALLWLTASFTPPCHFYSLVLPTANRKRTPFLGRMILTKLCSQPSMALCVLLVLQSYYRICFKTYSLELQASGNPNAQAFCGPHLENLRRIHSLKYPPC